MLRRIWSIITKQPDPLLVELLAAVNHLHEVCQTTNLYASELDGVQHQLLARRIKFGLTEQSVAVRQIRERVKYIMGKQ